MMFLGQTGLEVHSWSLSRRRYDLVHKSRFYLQFMKFMKRLFLESEGSTLLYWPFSQTHRLV